MTPASDGALDLAVIERLVTTLGEDGPVLVAGVIETYLAEAPALLAAMRQAMARGRIAEIRDSAHSLKSSAAALGATRLSDACAQLEAAAEADDGPAAARLVDRVEAEHEAAQLALEETIITLGRAR